MSDLQLALSAWCLANFLWMGANLYGTMQARRQWYLADRLMRHANSEEYRQLRADREAAYVREAIRDWEEQA